MAVILNSLPFLIVSAIFLLPTTTKGYQQKPSELKKHEQQTYQHEDVKQKFDKIKKWVDRFEHPERDEWQRASEVIKMMGLRSDSRIADIGSATGYFPVRFAKSVPKGKVYGIDIEDGMVNYLNERAKKEGLSNLISILGQPHNPKLPEPVDFIFICNTYHHISERIEYFKRLRKDFIRGGQLVIVDFRKGNLPVGPPDSMKLSSGQVISELGGAGFNLTRRSDILPYQYILIFRPESPATDLLERSRK